MINTNYKEIAKEFSDDLSIFNHLYDIAKENRNKTMMDAMNRAIFLTYQYHRKYFSDEQFRTIKYYANPKIEEMVEDFVKKYPMVKDVFE